MQNFHQKSIHIDKLSIYIYRPCANLQTECVCINAMKPVQTSKKQCIELPPDTINFPTNSSCSNNLYKTSNRLYIHGHVYNEYDGLERQFYVERNYSFSLKVYNVSLLSVDFHTVL